MRRLQVALSIVFVALGPVLGGGAASGGDDVRGTSRTAGGGTCRDVAVGERGPLRGITAAHNQIRNRIPAGRSGHLPDLEWSSDLARVAQAHADALADGGCSLVHSANPYGENLYWARGFEPSAHHVVQSWASEAACYHPISGDLGRCTPIFGACGVCGHYAQIIRQKVRRVGCGIASCGGEQVWVCNYDQGRRRESGHVAANARR